jgi:hypothetical protein
VAANGGLFNGGTSMGQRVTKRTVNVAGAWRVTCAGCPGVEVFTYTDPAGRFCAYAYRSPRQCRPEFHHVFRDETQRDDFVTRFLTHETEKAAAKSQKKTQNDLPNPTKVDQIWVHTWGYEQTNQDFYQVVEVKGKNVVLRRIRDEVVDANAQGLSIPEQSMSEYVVARRHCFLEGPEGAPITKRVQRTQDGRLYVRFDYGWCQPWDGGKKYQSHYA